MDKPISPQLLKWFAKHGRHDLPWQSPRSLYRVWVSEVMLQQTQVTTVIPYFERFMEHFPDIRTLADAPVDEVLHLWTGLGYYARARNLHKAAAIIRDQHDCRFPEHFDDVLALPGIGRSTAGAILAQALGQSHAILDGNAKRVLCRYYAITGWPGNSAVEKQLWSLAEKNTPVKLVADYTQAIMDLGATICRRSRPLCHICPLADSCLALTSDLVSEIPEPRPKKNIPVRQTTLLMLCKGNQVLLERRPPAGIWGGLWSFPEIKQQTNNELHEYCVTQYDCQSKSIRPWQSFRHTFSHFHLDIQPVYIHVEAVGNKVRDSDILSWYDLQNPDARGLAAPVKSLLENLKGERHDSHG